MDEIKQIREIVAWLLAQKQPVLLAIDGYGGAGKTTLAKEIQNEFPGSSIITLDDFATDTESGADRKRFLSEVLVPLSEGRSANYQRFDWRAKSHADWITVKPEGLIIIEGVSVVGEDFKSYYDFRIWIDCPFELAVQRMKERDRKNGIGQNSPKWFNVCEKEDWEYGKTEPWRRADLIVKVRGA
jgi:uridine kinase